MFKKWIIFSVVLSFILCSFQLYACGENDKTTCYNISCELENNVLYGKEKVQFYNNYQNALDELKFNLYANAFRKGAKKEVSTDSNYYATYYSGESYGEIEIIDVKNEESLEFNICGNDENILLVKLKETLFPDESVYIEIEYKLSIPKIVGRLGINEKTINLANFYPILCTYSEESGFYECDYSPIGDPFCYECANYNVELTCDSEYIIASSGALVKSDVKDTIQTNTYAIDKARSFAFVLCKDFEIYTTAFNNTQINYYCFNENNAKEYLDTAYKSLEYYSNTFGEYPYSTYSVVQTEFVQGGMEYCALSFISSDLEKSAFNEVIIHETAHQWWEVLVGNNEIEESFLDEGLAEYSVVLFYENNSEYGFTKESLMNSALNTYKTFCSISDKLFKNTNTVMKRNLSTFQTEYEYVNIAYIKGCIMFDSLRSFIGEDNFFNGLKNYCSQYKYKIATADDLKGIFNKEEKNAEGYIDSFIFGKVVL